AWARGCAEQFELAQRTDMESFRDYDRETFREGHDPRSVTIFASGAVRYGIDAIMAALESHFANREAIWAWTELYRVVDGCKSAFILYDATYDIPSIGYPQRTLTGVADARHAARVNSTPHRPALSVDRRPGDVRGSTIVDMEQRGVPGDDPLGCSIL